jgi:hypothetical protein
MIAVKKLVLFLEHGFAEMGKTDGNFDMKLLKSLTDDAITYLKKSKSFEYDGEMKLPGVALKLLELNMDFDDVIKELVDKRTDIEFKGSISLIIEEVKQEKKAA